MSRVAAETTEVDVPHYDSRPIRRRFAVDGRVRTGCLTCKARKKKCDEQHSATDHRCQSCARLGLVCQRVPLRTVQTKPRTRRKQAALSKDGAKKDQVPRHEDGGASASGLAISIIPPERALLRYYLERLAPLCSILQQGSNNEFCTVILPMAIVDSALLCALFTYASVHIGSCAVPLDGEVTSSQRIEFENRAARGLSEAIKQDAVSETTVACALISSSAAVISGDASRGNLHLRGAGHLIQRLGVQRLLRSPDGVFLVRNFAYHDIMAALSTGRRPMIPGAYWAEGAGIISADCLMGVAHELLGHISDLCSFVADANDSAACLDAADGLGILLRGDALASAIRSQNLGFCISLGNGDLETLVHHAEAFRFAALMHLYISLRRFLGSATMYETEMGECVQTIMSHVTKVPLDIYCEIGLVFPLFMAGVGGWDDVDVVEYVRNRLERLGDWTNFKHVGRVLQLLEVLWADGRMDWDVVLRELDWQISLA